jgi:hypothetical protein
MLYIHVHTLYMGTTLFMHVTLRHILACTAFELAIYNAVVQESAVRYMQGSYRDIPPKNGTGRWL